MSGFPSKRRTKKKLPEEGKITELRPLNKDPSRIAIKLAGIYLGALPLDRVNQLQLTEGKYLTPAFVRQLADAIEEADCRWQALNLLSYRPRSVAEMRRRLSQKGFGKYLVERIIKSLLEKGYLNDAEFARTLVKSGTEGERPQGSFVLRRKLWQAGIDDETAQQGLAEIESEYENCKRAADGVLKRYNRLPKLKARQRLYGYLARRGFSVDDIKLVISELEDRLGQDSPEEN
jgi:regulatory protein